MSEPEEVVKGRVTFTPIGNARAAKKIVVPPIYKVGGRVEFNGELFTIYETDGFTAKARRYEEAKTPL